MFTTKPKIKSLDRQNEINDLLQKRQNELPISEEKKLSVQKPALKALKKISKENVKINRSSIIKDDLETAELFYSVVNPKKIPDGHCARCAFNTHIHLMGGDLEEAEASNTEEFVRFSFWFYANFSPEVVDCEKTISGRSGESLDDFQKRVERSIKKITSPKSGVLISINEGAHWFNAYNDGDKIWFIDSQTGQGFNVYSKKFDPELTVVNIVKVTSEKIFEFNDKMFFCAQK